MTTQPSRALGPVVRRGQATSGDFCLSIDPAAAGWTWCGLKILELPPDGVARFATGESETIVLPLRGSCRVRCAGSEFLLSGREEVFSGVSDFVYLPRDAEARIDTVAGGRFALPSARADRRLPARHVPASEVPVELRGAGSASRQVNNFCAAEVFEADRLIAVEVLTPGGNWSSFPPHKHDDDTGTESKLEEIYYFEVAGDGPAYQRVYSSGPGTAIDVLAQVSTGDVVLVPHGYHGPSMAAPGYDMYYLNVMAGAGQRLWRVSDDPAHAWIRGTWNGMPIDPRLPLTSAAGAR